METLVLLCLLAYANGDDNFKQKLRSALDFYRENRELISMLIKNEAPMSETEPPQSAPKSSETPKPSEAQESRPQSEAGNMDVLIKYLGGLH